MMKRDPPSSLERRIWKAAADGDVRALAPLLVDSKQSDLEWRDTDQNTTALFAASLRGHIGAVEMLLRAGALRNVLCAEGFTSLMAAAQGGHVEIVRLLLRAGADKDIVGIKGSTALFIAAQNGHSAVVATLIAAGANPEKAVESHLTPLFVAAKAGCRTICMILCEAGADPNRSDSDGRSPLLVASTVGFKDVVAALLLAGANPNIGARTPLCIDPMTPLVSALIGKKGSVADLLASFGAVLPKQWRDFFESDLGHARIAEVDQIAARSSPRQARAAAMRVLMEAALEPPRPPVPSQPSDRVVVERHPDAVSSMPPKPPPACVAKEMRAARRKRGGGGRRGLRGSHQPDESFDEFNDEDQWRPLSGPRPELEAKMMQSVYMGRVARVAALIDDGANPKHVEHDGCTALHIACEFGHAEIARVLLAAGADANAAIEGPATTPLLFATQGQHEEIVDLLLHATPPANPDKPNSRGTTPLLMAASRPSIAIVESLLRAGANPDTEDRAGSTPLMISSFCGLQGHAESLVRAGAKLNTSRRSDGATALLFACQEAHLELAESLIKSGANPRATDSRGFTILHNVCRHGMPTMIQLLRNSGADLNALDADGGTPILLAARTGNAGAVIALIKANADLEKADRTGMKPLLAASMAGHRVAAELLLSAGANPNTSETADGLSPLMAASGAGHKEIVRALIRCGAKVNRMNRSGNTPIVAACMIRRYEIAEMLASAGALLPPRTRDAIKSTIGQKRIDELDSLASDYYDTVETDPEFEIDMGNPKLQAEKKAKEEAEKAKDEAERKAKEEPAPAPAPQAAHPETSGDK